MKCKFSDFPSLDFSLSVFPDPFEGQVIEIKEDILDNMLNLKLVKL